MDIQTAKLLASYNASANMDMNKIIHELSDSQWKMEFLGFFKSIQSLCNHLYIADFVWLRRFSGLRSFTYIEHKIFSEDINFGMVVVNSISEYEIKRKGLDGVISLFAADLNEKDFSSDLTYKDSGGNEHKRNFGGLVLHMFNHQTHHRGMISLYLENLGIENDFNSLFEIL